MTVVIQASCTIMAASVLKDVLIASVVLNVVLGVALFFKSALNDIIVRWYTEHREERRRSRELLNELYARMQRFPTEVFVSLLEMMYPDPVTPEVQRRRDAAEQDVRSTLDFLSKSELYFPPSIRTLVVRLRADYRIKDLKDRRSSPNQLLAHNAEVRRIAEAIQAEVARLIGKR